MSIIQDSEHSDGAPIIEGTGIRVKDVAVAYEHSGYEPDEITQLYPDLSLGDVHRALAYYYDNIDNKERLGDSDRGRARPEDTDWDPNAWRLHLWRRWVTHLGSFRLTPLVSSSETDPSPHLLG